MDVWTYWEGKKPLFIDVCLASLKRVCRKSTFHLLTPENYQDFVGSKDIVPEYNKIPDSCANVRANVLRAAILARHGGLWCDADTVALQDPILLLEKYPDLSTGYMTWSTPPVRVLNGYIYCKPDSRIAREWLGRVNFKLSNNFNLSIKWLELGEKILSLFIQADSESQQLPLNTFLPIEIDCDVERFFQPEEFWDYLVEDTLMVGLNHSYFMYHKKEAMALPLSQWYKSPLLLHKLLIYAHNLNKECS